MTVPKMIEMLKNRMPSGEIFRRIRPKKLVELLDLHAYELEQKARLEAEQELEQPSPTDPSAVPNYHHMHSSIHFGDNDPAPQHQPTPAEAVDCPFILLDVRDEEEFENCHIHGAKCYPKARLSRATNYFTPEILAFRGHPQKVVVVYCDYGHTSGEAAQMFAERGFDNIFLLHGGLSEFALQYPNLCGPNPPPPPLQQSKKVSSGVSAASKAPVVHGLKRNKAQPKPGEKKPWK